MRWEIETHGEAWVTTRKGERYGRARVPGRCGKCSPKCSRGPGDEVHEFPWAVVDLSVAPARIVSYERCGTSADRTVKRILADESCAACGKDYVSDPDMPVEVFRRECGCHACEDCDEVFLENDWKRGVTIASSDELAAKHGDGKCQACWAKVGSACA